MQTTSLTTTSRYSDGLRVVERSRGTAHPQATRTRDRVARSLLLRPEPSAPRYARR